MLFFCKSGNLLPTIISYKWIDSRTFVTPKSIDYKLYFFPVLLLMHINYFLIFSCATRSSTAVTTARHPRHARTIFDEWRCSSNVWI